MEKCTESYLASQYAKTSPSWQIQQRGSRVYIGALFNYTTVTTIAFLLLPRLISLSSLLLQSTTAPSVLWRAGDCWLLVTPTTLETAGIAANNNTVEKISPKSTSKQHYINKCQASQYIEISLHQIQKAASAW
jgi:hypothetical protein